MKCAICEQEHELLEPFFSRPDVIFAMSAEEKNDRVMENDDICALHGEDGGADRYFIRCTLPVQLLDAPETSAWGLWAEVSEEDSVTIWNAWDDPEQNRIPPMRARVANRIPGYPDTIDLPVVLKLTGPTTRPQLSFTPDARHPFAAECVAGVCAHRVTEWLEAMT
jgi:hypothetical protein